MILVGLSGFLLLASAVAPGDEVLLNDSAFESTVLVDAVYPGGCTNDRAFSGTASGGQTQIPIGDADQGVGCTSELVVMSEEHALILQSQPALAPANASIQIDLQDRVEVPVFTVVLVEVPPDTHEKEERETEAIAELEFASSAFAAGGAGIEFVHHDLEFMVDADWVSEIRQMVVDVWFGRGDGRQLREALRARRPQVLNTVTAFRIDAGSVRGMHLREDGGHSSGMLVVGSDGTPSTLGHELGHVLSLDHVNFWGYDVRSDERGMYCVAYGLPPPYDGQCDFRQANLMWSETDVERTYLSLGQGFRTSVNSRSFVNTGTPPLRPSSEPRRDCEDWRYSDECPYISLEAD